VALFVGACLLRVAVASEPSDDEFGSDEAPGAEELRAAELKVYGWITGTTASASREQLKRAILQKVAVVDRVCTLTDV
jgi:hypothetical protein